jgi:hypothetical protein
MPTSIRTTKPGLVDLPGVDDLWRLHVATGDLFVEVALGLEDRRRLDETLRAIEKLMEQQRGARQYAAGVFRFGQPSARIVLTPEFQRKLDARTRKVLAMPAAQWLVKHRLGLAKQALRRPLKTLHPFFEMRVLHAVSGALIWFLVQSNGRSRYAPPDRRAVGTALRATERLLALSNDLRFGPEMRDALDAMLALLLTYRADPREHVDQWFAARWYVRVLVPALDRIVGEAPQEAVARFCGLIGYEPDDLGEQIKRTRNPAR